MAQHPKVWQHGLFPLQSPLLRESLLVSFPPLNYMLKFGGSSCLIGDPNGGGIANESFPSFFSFLLLQREGKSCVLAYVHPLWYEAVVVVSSTRSFF
jgi:hypothetical protein